MFNKIKEFFLGNPKAPAPEAPYKIEAPDVQWPFPRPGVAAQETAPAKKPRAAAKPKAALAEKPVVLKKPRAKKTPAK